MPHATQIFTQVKRHKGSVRYDTGAKYPLFNGQYLNREAAAKLLGVKNLDKEDEIEVTVRIRSGKKSKIEGEDEIDD